MPPSRSVPAAAAAHGADARALVPADAAYRTPEGRIRVVGYNDMADAKAMLESIAPS